MIGSTFWFTLPLTKQTEEEQARDFSGQNINDAKVLVLSDGATLGKNFEKNLLALEIEYDQAFDETEALEMLRWAQDESEPFHLVILEAKESDTAAEAFGKKLKQDELFKQTKLMLLTAVGQKGDARRFEQVGFMAFLSKPVEKSLLSDCIKAVLAQPVPDDAQNQSIITRYSIMETKKHLAQILIVDDIDTNLLTAKALIDKLGYKTDEARNGAQAVEKHKENIYDLILMDCQMPIMDGFEATRKIRQSETNTKLSTVPIIAMTGNAFESDKEKCFAAGMDDFISKPVEPDILARKISLNLADSVHYKSEQASFLKEEAASQEIEKESQVESEKSEDAGANETGKQTKQDPVTHPDADICFNKKKLMERFGQDEEIVEVVLDSFFQEAPDLIDNIETAINDSDMEQVRLNSHALKGSAANVNADLLKNAALALETEAKSQNSALFAAKFETIQEEYKIFVGEAVL